jgi:phage/plasmid-like protein (TIGR03299 family)
MSDPRGMMTIMDTTNAAVLDRTSAFNAERLQTIQALKDGQADAVARAEAYNAQIDEKIKDGRLVSLGNDRYQVVDPGSWDNNEIWTYRKLSTEAPALLLPEHGLLEDEETGRVSLYRKRPAWHDLGQYWPEGLSDISQVLKESGLDYDVEQRPARYTFKGKNLVVPNSYVNVRSDNGEPFSVVGRFYTPVQNRDAFEFLQNLADDGSVVFETAGETARKRIFVSMRLPETLKIDEGGLNDELYQYVAAFNSHDGQSPFQVVATPWAPLCGNTERFALRDAVTRWAVRHTSSATARFAEARKTLGLSLRYYEQLAEEETALARTNATIDDFWAVTRELWETKDPENETKRSEGMRVRREEALEELWAKNSARAGRTAYAAERAFTEYLDSVAPRRAVGDKLAAARATAVLEGTDDDKKAKAHQKLMLLVQGGREAA